MKLFLIAVCVLSVTLVSARRRHHYDLENIDAAAVLDDSYDDFGDQLVEEYSKKIRNNGKTLSVFEFEALYHQFKEEWDNKFSEKKQEMMDKGGFKPPGMFGADDETMEFFKKWDELEDQSNKRKEDRAEELSKLYEEILENQYSPPGPVESSLKHPGKPLNEDEDCKCRFRGASRIVNGQITKPNEIPWQVSLQTPFGSHFCGGTIISPEYILTAAHCIDTKTPEDLKVRVGAHSLEEEDPEKTHNVINIISGDFMATKLERPGDIAILRLDRPIKFIPGIVEPGCLNFEEQSYTNDLLASGWGATSTTKKDLKTGQMLQGEISTVLKKAHFHEDRDGCPKHEIRDSNYLICIASNNEGDSTCQGDSGGPLHYTQNGRTAVQGVLSFGTSAPIKEGDTHSVTCIGSSVYSRLSHYKRWVESIVGENYCH